MFVEYCVLRLFFCVAINLQLFIFAAIILQVLCVVIVQSWVVFILHLVCCDCSVLGGVYSSDLLCYDCSVLGGVYSSSCML